MNARTWFQAIAQPSNVRTTECPVPRTSLPRHLSGFRVRLRQAEVCRSCGHAHRRTDARGLRFRSAPSPILVRLARWGEAPEGAR